jgi:hypothetical protein
MQEARVLTIGYTKLLQAAVELDEAADAENLMARIDYLADAARWHQITRLHRRERIQRQPQRTRQE